MCKTNYLISVSNGGKVVDLSWSKDLVELLTIKMLHPGSEIEVMKTSDFCKEEIVIPAIPAMPFYRNGKPFANKVRCVETGNVFDSVMDCYRKMGINPVSIYKSIRTGNLAAGYHFEYFNQYRHG